jgi:hypothetical protein
MKYHEMISLPWSKQIEMEAPLSAAPLFVYSLHLAEFGLLQRVAVFSRMSQHRPVLHLNSDLPATVIAQRLPRRFQIIVSPDIVPRTVFLGAASASLPESARGA